MARGMGPADEPAVYTGGVIAGFSALVTLLSAFGVIRLSTEQMAALAAFAVIVLPWLQGLITRQWVRPVAHSLPKRESPPP